MMALQKIQSAFGLYRNRKKAVDAEATGPFIPKGVLLEETFPAGFHVYGFSATPPEGTGVMVGAGNPATAQGAVFLGEAGGEWKQIDLPEETALVSHFVRLPDGRYVAGGMSAIGRAAILIGDKTATEWKTVNEDLHAFSSISALIQLPSGELLAASGQMITQGKTKPILLRSVDQGATWQKETFKLPITLFYTFTLGPDGTLYAGTCGDVMPTLYKSSDGGRTWEPMPALPMYKTYKMPALRWVNVSGVNRLFMLLWGYKSDIADRVVRLYALSADGTTWEDLPLIEDSHFIFSFYVARSGAFYVGSEKGRVYRSDDFGKSWKRMAEFPTNIGAYALHEDPKGKIWIGKDYVPPSDYSLWRLA